MSEVSADELREAVEHLHGCSARFVRVHRVEDRFRGDVAWRGIVHEFALAGHPTASIAFAWSHLEDDVSERRRFLAVLAEGPIQTPTAAVRAAAVEQFHREHPGAT